MKKNAYTFLRSVALTAVCLGYTLTSRGQEKKHEFALSAGGIFSYLDYDLEKGKLENGHGYNVGIRYSYFLSKNWSIGVGAEYQFYNSTATIESLTDSYLATDSEGESFEFRYTATNLEEKQRVGYLNLPLTLQYETGDSPAFYATVGAKIGFAVNKSFQTSTEELRTSGYYPQYNVELFDPRFAGFGNFGSIQAEKQDLDLEMAYLATFEAGLKQITDSDTPVYIGLYIDYGLNSIIKKNGKKETLEYPDSIPVDFRYNSVLTSSDTDEVHLTSYGVKVRVGIL